MIHVFRPACIEWVYADSMEVRQMGTDIDDLIFGTENPGPSDR